MKHGFRILKDLRHSLFYTLVTSKHRSKLTLGQKCTWTIDPRYLSEQSIVYSAGAGDDISFEKELIARFGCQVILLDPSPTGKLTMSLPENKDPKLIYEPVGLADRDETFHFGIPSDREGASYYKSDPAKTDGISFPCLSLPTLMRKHGHEQIDLLKIDVEGFEYGVLDQILALKLPVQQICVEFHHFCIPEYSSLDTIKHILRLRRAGYSLIHRLHWDHTFLLK